MFKKALFIAGLLSVMSVSNSAYADNRHVLSNDESILEGIKDVVTVEENARGGAIQNAGGYNLTVGGTISGNQLKSAIADQISLGGAIFQQGGTLTVKDGTTFENNTVTGYEQSYPGYPQNDYPSGGAITQYGGTFSAQGTVTFSGNEATGNEGYSTGGAIFFGSNANATFNNANFSDNKSGFYGGAIYADNSNVTITGKGDFQGNESWHGGGVMMLGEESNYLHIGASSNFQGNKTTGGNGGGIANYGTTVEIGENSTFTGNEAVKQGGAIFNAGGNVELAKGATFSGNKAKDGGAIENQIYEEYNATLTINEGTQFTNNSATSESEGYGRGGAIHTNSTVNINTGERDIVFSGNTANKGGNDIYLEDGANLNISGSGKVSFQSEGGSIAGGGNINLNSGIFEIKNNTEDNLKGFTGKYTQNSGKTILDNSGFFSNFDIQSGEFELKNGSKVTLDGVTKQVAQSGSVILTVGSDDGSKSTLTIGDEQHKYNLGKDVQIVLGESGVLDIVNGKVTFNGSAPAGIMLLADYSTDDDWKGTVKVGGEGEAELTLSGFTHDTSTGSYQQSGGKLTLEEGAKLSITDEESSITGGDITVNSGTTLDFSAGSMTGGTVDLQGDMIVTGGTFNEKFDTQVKEHGNLSISGGGEYQGKAEVESQGQLNVTGGTVSGETTNNGGNITVSGNGSITGNLTNQSGNVNVNSGGSITGSGTLDLQGGKLTVEGGTVDKEGQTKVGSSAEVDVKSGSFTMQSGDEWSGSVKNEGGKVTLNGFDASSKGGHYQGTGGELDLEGGAKLKLGDGDSVSGGDVNVKGNSQLEVGSGSSVSENNFTVSGESSDLKVSEGGSISGGTITASDNGSLTVDGGNITGSAELTADGGQIDVKNNGKIEGGSIDVKGEGGSLTVEGGGSVSGGTITSSGKGSVTVGDGGSISGGSVTAKDGGSVNVGENGSIKDGASVTAEAGGSVDVKSGGTIEGGNITVSGEGSSFKNEGTITGGEITLGEHASFDSTGEIDGGSFTFEGKLEGNALIESEIKKEAKYNLGGGNTFEIKDKGNLTVNSDETDGDNWLENSTVQLGSAPEEEPSANGGTFNFEGTKNGTNGVLKAYSGNLKVNGKNPDGVTSQALKLGEGSVIAKEVNTTIDSELDVDAGSEVTLDSSDEWNESGHVVVEGGKLTLEDVTDKSGYLTQTSGDTTVNGEFDMNNADDSFTGGNLHITEGSTLKQSNGTITSNAELDIQSGGNLTLSGGETHINGNDKWTGEIDVSDSGDLQIATSKGKTGALKQSGGKVTVKGEFDLNNADDDISGGEFIIKNATNTPTNLTQSAGKIEKNAKVTLEDNSTLTLTGGTTTLDSSTDSADTWAGNVYLSESGNLTLEGFSGKEGKLMADGGSLTMTSGSSIQLGANEYIKEATKFDLEAGNTLGVTTGSEVTFNEGDTWQGDVTLKGGTLTYDLKSNGKLDAQTGSLNTVKESNLTIAGGSKIGQDVAADIQGKLTISGESAENRGTVSLNENDTVTGDITINNHGLLEMGDNVKMAESGQTITFSGSNAQMDLNGQGNLDLKAALVSETGNGIINKNGDGDVNFKGLTSGYKGNFVVNGSGRLDFFDEQGLGGNLTFGNIEGKDITIASDKVMGTTTLDKKATITFETHTDGKDLTLGEVDVSNEGTINANAKSGGLSFTDTVSANNGTIGAFGNTVTFSNGITAEDNSNINIYSANEASLGAVNLKNSALNVAGAGFTAESVTFTGTNSVNVMDGAMTDNNMGQLTLKDKATGEFGIDIAPRNWKSDTFLTGAVTEGGTLHVSDFAFMGKAPIDRHIGLQVFQGSFSEDTLFTATDKEIFTPIGWYGLTSRGGGYYTASLRRYNDQVFRGQVTAVANYQNQMVLNNILFDHIQLINNQYFSDTTANKYAAAYPQFAPYQYNKKDGSLWYKGFGTFEKLDMTRGLDVNNNFYGALVGADFPAIEMKHGWTFLPTAYLAYTGAHQTYANMGMTQNGGQGGVMGSFMKNDFIGSVLAFGGGYGNQMDVAGFTDDNGNWYVGAATKAAYNFHPTKHFIIQPNALVGWNMFGRSNWYTGFGDMNMKTGLLNGVNVAPGVNFIYGRETWSVYLTAQYFFNVMSSVNGRAGNVDLPAIGMRHGYLEYGFGATKTWKDRFSAYLQFVVRNIGRTGIGFQGGMMFRL